jgi:transcriptional regulator with XRE-family HTH domain
MSMLGVGPGVAGTQTTSSGGRPLGFFAGTVLVVSAMAGTGSLGCLAPTPQVVHIGGQTSTPFVGHPGDGRRSTEDERDEAATDGETVSRLHQISGLTWEQLAKVFGVSRRTLHMWAAGARMNAVNSETLHHVLARVEALGGESPEDVRTRLLRIGTDGLSLYDRLREERSSGRKAINAPQWRAAELLADDELAGGRGD